MSIFSHCVLLSALTNAPSRTPLITHYTLHIIHHITHLQVPEGMELRKLAAGGRHSAGITACGKVLSWGWGEEGQLGHGTERNANLPRPCRVPKVQVSLSSRDMSY